MWILVSVLPEPSVLGRLASLIGNIYRTSREILRQIFIQSKNRYSIGHICHANAVAKHDTLRSLPGLIRIQDDFVHGVNQVGGGYSYLARVLTFSQTITILFTKSIYDVQTDSNAAVYIIRDILKSSQIPPSHYSTMIRVNSTLDIGRCDID